VGAAIEGVETKVSEAGELLIRSPMNMIGYHREPQMTADAFDRDGFFRTGDLVAIEPDGQMKIVGRLKEQFKTSKGKYVAPAPIESRLMEHPAVEACCLLGSGQPSPFGMIILAPAVRERCVDPDERRRVEEGLLRRLEEINGDLDPFERVSMLVIADGPWTVGNGFVTPTLKIKRGSVEDRYHQLVDEWRNRAAPIVWESEPVASPGSLPATAGPESRDAVNG
jgi:long-chain acyl-CoA synthetase